MDWLKKNWKDVYPRDYITIDGNKYSVPRAYDKWMENKDKELFKRIKRKRIKEAIKRSKDMDWDRIASERLARETKLGYTSGTRDQN